jgi:hypothetical protein
LKKKEIKNFGRILALIGALVTLIFGILDVLQMPYHIAQFWGYSLGLLVDGIILIILALVIFASYGLLNISLKFKVSWLMILIVAIVAYIFGGDLGALLLILSAIVYIIAEL